MPSPVIAKDLIFRAAIQDDTAKGAKSAQKTMKDLVVGSGKMWVSPSPKSSNDRLAIYKGVGESLRNLEAETNASILRQNGEFFEAERVLRERAYKQEIADIERQAQAKIAANKGSEVAALTAADIEKKRAARRYQDDQRKSVDDEAKSIEHRIEERGKKLSEKYGIGGNSASGKGGGHGGGLKGHLGRLLTDKSTTGLNPLLRTVTGAAGEQLGVGLKLFGVAVAGQALNTLAEKAEEISNHFRDGQHNAADLTLEVGKTIPIVGNFASAGEHINEIFTHQKSDLEAINSTTASIVQLTDTWASLSRKVREEQNEYGRALARDDRQLNAIGKRGIDSERQAIRDKYTDQREANDNAREEAKNSALDNPELKAAQAAKKAFEDKYGGRTLTGPLADQKEKLDKAAKDIAAKVNQERDNKIGFLNADDAKKGQMENAEMAEKNDLYRQQIDLQQKSHRLEILRSAGDVGVQNAQTEGYGEEARRAAIENQANDAKEEARIQAETRKNATTNAEERVMIEQQLADKLKSIDAKKNADRAAAAKEEMLNQKRFTFSREQAEADATESENENSLRARGATFQADMNALKYAHDKRNKEINQDAEERIVHDRDHAADIRREAEANKRSNDAAYVSQQRQQAMGLLQQAQSQNPVSAISLAGRTTGIAERFKQNFNPFQPLLDLMQKELQLQGRIANAVEGKGKPTPPTASSGSGVFSMQRAG